MSIFTRPGLYLRNPRGGVETVSAMALDGFWAIALNVGDHTPDEWARVIERAEAAGVAWLPWARVYSDEDVRVLCDSARTFPAGAVIVNAERELFTGEVSLEVVEAETRGLSAALSIEPWAGDLELSLVQRLVVHVQLFPQENDASTRPRDCRAHAYARGASRVEFMLGMHDLDESSFPARQGGFWVYTADDMASNYARWSPMAIPPLTLPYTGPLYGPTHPRFKPTGQKSGTAKALKIALHNAGFANFPKPDLAYNRELEKAMVRLQRWAGISPLSGSYGRGSYEAVRRLASVTPGETYALTPAAEELVRSDVVEEAA